MQENFQWLEINSIFIQLTESNAAQQSVSSTAMYQLVECLKCLHIYSEMVSGHHHQYWLQCLHWHAARPRCAYIQYTSIIVATTKFSQ